MTGGAHPLPQVATCTNRQFFTLGYSLRPSVPQVLALLRSACLAGRRDRIHQRRCRASETQRALDEVAQRRRHGSSTTFTERQYVGYMTTNAPFVTGLGHGCKRRRAKVCCTAAEPKRTPSTRSALVSSPGFVFTKVIPRTRSALAALAVLVKTVMLIANDVA